MTNLAAKLKTDGRTQTEIAKLVGTSQTMISLYANGLRCPADVLARLSEVLNCDADDLVGEAVSHDKP